MERFPLYLLVSLSAFLVGKVLGNILNICLTDMNTSTGDQSSSGVGPPVPRAHSIRRTLSAEVGADGEFLGSSAATLYFPVAVMK